MSDKTDRATKPKRNKTGLGPEYKHIPRDAAGDPLFLILPDEVRADFDHKLALCEAGWRKTRDPLFITEACVLTRIHRQVMPAWLEEAIYGLTTRRRTKAHVKAAREAAAHVMRYLTVRDAHDLERLSWEKARERAEEVLADSSAAAEADTCWRSYKAVARDLRANRGGLYVTGSGRGRMYVVPPKKRNRRKR
jgi:hypothetical protein